MTPRRNPRPAPSAYEREAAAEYPSAGRTFWTNLNRPFTLGFMLVLGGMLAWVLGMAVGSLSTIIIYIVTAMFIALGLNPLVEKLQERGLARGWAMLIVIAGFAVIVTGVLLLIIPTVVRQVSAFVQNLPALVVDIQHTDAYLWAVERFGDPVSAGLTQFENFVSNPANLAALGGGALQVGMGIFGAFSGGLIIVVLTLYFVASLNQIKFALIQLAPAWSRPKTTGIVDQIIASIGGYVGGMVVLAFFNAVVSFFLHLFIGLPAPALMAVIAFLITLIPLIGSVLYLAIATGLALFSGWVPALIFGLCYFVYIQLEAYVLTPRVMNKAISVPGALVVIGALVGGTLLGLLGALVAIPVTASILLIIKQIYIPRQNAKKVPPPSVDYSGFNPAAS